MSGKRGFALLSALWLTVAISALTLALALDTHRDNLAVANLTESAQALAAARAGVETALSRLERLKEGTEPPPFVPVTPTDPWQYCDTLLSETQYLNGPGSAGYRLRVQDAGAVLDINQASDFAWTNFFGALNVDADAASHLAATIGDWRDVDDNTRENGAERAEYLSAGRVVLPPNTDFGAIEDLLDVMGMTPAIYEAARPYLALSSTGNVSVNTAPLPVLSTIPQFSQNVVANILARRQSGQRYQSLSDLASAGVSATDPILRRQLTFTTQTVLITSTGWSPGGHTHVTETVELTQGTPNARVVWRRDE